MTLLYGDAVDFKSDSTTSAAISLAHKPPVDPNPSSQAPQNPVDELPPPLPANHNQVGAELTAGRSTVCEPDEDRRPQLDDILHARFGLDVPAVASDLRLGAIRLDSNALTLEEVAAVVMEKHGSADVSTKDAVRYIVTTLQKEKTISPRYWDLHARSPAPLRCHSNRFFMFVNIQIHLDGDPSQILEGYKVYPTNSQYQHLWTVVLDSPITVTHCIRDQWGPSLENVVERAVEEGYAIHVLRRCSKHNFPPRCEPPVLFGRRERGQEFQANREDYIAYLSAVGVLMQQPRLRSVIFRGGILARIYTKFIHMEDLLDGPSVDAERYGMRWVGMGEDCWVEDYISDAEMELVIGMFYISTGRGNQTAKKSFSPSPSVRGSSGLNTRVWSNSAEEKYQSILRTLTESDGGSTPSTRSHIILSAAEWRQNMRYFKNKTQNFLGLMEHKAHAVITRQLLANF